MRIKVRVLCARDCATCHCASTRDRGTCTFFRGLVFHRQAVSSSIRLGLSPGLAVVVVLPVRVLTGAPGVRRRCWTKSFKRSKKVCYPRGAALIGSAVLLVS